MSKARASTLETSKSTEEATGEGKKRKERVKKTMAKVIGRSSMMVDPAEDEKEEEQDAAPEPKSQKLMGDAIKSGAAPSKPKTAPEASAPTPKSAPKRSTRNISAAEKNKAQCLKLKLKKKMMLKPKCLGSSSQRSLTMMTTIEWQKT